MYPPQQRATNGSTILVLGILSLVICGLLGPVAWIMGNNALKELNYEGVDQSDRGLVVAGRICGIVATALMIAAIFIWCLVAGTIFTSKTSKTPTPNSPYDVRSEPTR
jgi:hypothetical protein